MAQPITARARPKQLTITERYHSKVDVDLSVNARNDGGAYASGKIEVVTPFDGHEYFTRDAIKDVKRQLRLNHRATRARIGHLLFSNHHHTSLIEELEGGNHQPVHVTLNPNDLADLSRDTVASHTTIDYQVPQLPVPPITVSVDIFDEDALSYKRYRPGRELRDADEIKTFMRHASQLERKLTLLINISVEIPHRPQPGDRILIEKMSLDWPMATSYSPTDVKLNAQREGDKGVESEIATAYSPEGKGQISWTGIALREVGRVPTRGVVAYSADPITLTVRIPAELSNMDELNGRIEVTIPTLLSGLHLEYFDALGYRLTDLSIGRSSRLTADIKIKLTRYFKQRLFTPYQLLQFRNVVLKEMRVDDVKAVLTDLNFQFEPEKLTTKDIPEGGQQSLLAARQRYRADYLRLWILMEGTPSTTTRHTVFDGGVTHITPQETGHTTFYIWGELEQDSPYVLETINKIHLRLKERFEHVGAAE